ncbi:MAG: SdiA-regulated domain-containing protein [Calditrichota bacterium]
MTQIYAETSLLKLHKAYPIEGLENAQPSGLTVLNGELFTISDKRDTVIYKLDLEENVARFIKHIRFEPPAAEGILDLEGITYDDENFYLISEKQFQILRVTMADGQCNWASPGYFGMGKEKGFFGVSNAYFEGICRTAADRYVLAIERQPRGLLDVNLSFDAPSTRFVNIDNSKFEFRKNASYDFSGLDYYKGRVFALQRNAYAISEMIKTKAGYREGEGWSYKHVATSDTYRYKDMRYGHAEGLAIDDDYVYIILDNNDDERLSDGNDKRPLLFIFHNPGL